MGTEALARSACTVAGSGRRQDALLGATIVASDTGTQNNIQENTC